MMHTIFVQIASYRDPELVPTIQSCIDNATNPQCLRFCVVNQGHDQDEFYSHLDKFRSDHRFRVIDILHTQSQGVCWARALCQSHYNNEDYTMQIDSHMRFAQGWDDYFIQCLAQSGTSRPLLSAYVASYEVTQSSTQFEPHPGYQMVPSRITEDGSVHCVGHGFPHMPDHEPNRPVPARFVSGHFYFTLGQHCVECVYDPDFYFDGEETHLTVNSYTRGYDLFHPYQNYVWHNYRTYPRTLHWDDHDNTTKSSQGLTWWQRDIRSKARLRKYLGIEQNNEDLGFYTMGTVRTLAQYEAWAGVCFRKQVLHYNTLQGLLPPSVTDLSESWHRNFHQCWHDFGPWLEQARTENPMSYYVAVDDEFGRSIYHQWFQPHDLESWGTGGKIFSFHSDQQPRTLVLWGLLEAGKWGTKFTKNL